MNTQDSANGESSKQCRARNITGGRCSREAQIKELCVHHFRMIQAGMEIELAD